MSYLSSVCLWFIGFIVLNRILKDDIILNGWARADGIRINQSRYIYGFALLFGAIPVAREVIALAMIAASTIKN